MFTANRSEDFDRNFQPRERTSPLSKIALRRRGSDHPMAMFAMLVGVAFASMALSPTSGTAPTSPGAVAKAPVELAEGGATTDKTDRLPRSETDAACRGQAWGAESLECLTVIVKESGRSDIRKIRVIASAEADTDTPNIF